MHQHVRVLVVVDETSAFLEERGLCCRCGTVCTEHWFCNSNYMSKLYDQSCMMSVCLCVFVCVCVCVCLCMCDYILTRQVFNAKVLVVCDGGVVCAHFLAGHACVCACV